MSNPRSSTYFGIDKYTQASDVSTLQPSDQKYIGIRGDASVAVVAAIPQHIEVGVCEDVTKEIIKALPIHLSEITIIGNIKPEVVSSFRQNITTVIIRDITDQATVKALPRHIECVMLHRSISTQSVAALPTHFSKVGILRGFTPETAKAIPAHIKEARIHSGVSKEVISAIRSDIELFNPGNHPEIDALIQSRSKRPLDNPAPNPEPAKRPRIDKPDDFIARDARRSQDAEALKQHIARVEAAATLLTMPLPSPPAPSAPSISPLPIPSPFPTPLASSSGTSITISSSLFLSLKTPADRVKVLESSIAYMQEQIARLQQENVELKTQLGIVELPQPQLALPFLAKPLLVARITDLESSRARVQEQIDALSRDNAEFRRQLGMQEQPPRMNQ